MPSSLLTLSGQQFSDFHFTWTGGFGPGTYTLVNAQSITGLGSNTSGTIDGSRRRFPSQTTSCCSPSCRNPRPWRSWGRRPGADRLGVAAAVKNEWSLVRRELVFDKMMVRLSLVAALLASAVSAGTRRLTCSTWVARKSRMVRGMALQACNS